ncbi:SatD family protein [Flavobacteriaceae bacterium F89]|uniref:SatD family protein n=1 Tax=Cerina litoralis TaxID=2874477 RepID=A0AAE3EW44_9FLAO|nr:SatD family protein [Cerina litoralis]MCG2460777.1 SatD family protein [Cerina litoralis]
MVAIITGDIINSDKQKVSVWMEPLKRKLATVGESPTDWEIYRGDEFQLRIQPQKALRTAIHIKALIKSIKGLDVRIAIGLGTETFKGTNVSQSNGTAYQYSGRTFETLKEQKINLAMASSDKSRDRTFNLILKLALDFMDDWSTFSAEIVAMVLESPEASQQEIAEQLHIQQSAVSQRQKRARLDLVMELLDYCEQNETT